MMAFDMAGILGLVLVLNIMEADFVFNTSAKAKHILIRTFNLHIHYSEKQLTAIRTKIRN